MYICIYVVYMYLCIYYMGVCINGGVPRMDGFKGNPTKMDDLRIPIFMETSIYIYIYTHTLIHAYMHIEVVSG